LGHHVPASGDPGTLFFYLYLFMDVFSRKIVGWQIYAEESSAQASEVLKDLCAREAIQPNQVILHSDTLM
jgi:putative transposase